MKKIKRPWGLFKQFAFNEKCTVKVLVVNSFQELSLQVHKKRDEIWYFFDDGIIQKGNSRIRVKEGETITINRKTPHRIIAGKNKLRVLEVSFGNFDESDEIRLEDRYGRK